MANWWCGPRPGLTSSRSDAPRSMAGATGLEPATSGVTGRRSNQLSYAPAGLGPGRALLPLPPRGVKAHPTALPSSDGMVGDEGLEPPTPSV